MEVVLYVWLVALSLLPSIRAATCPAASSGTQTYPYTATIPSGCQQASCTYFLGVRKNANDPTYLEFWMEGTAAGYTAVGFSTTGLMDNSDVIMCGVDATAIGGVGIVDAYNVAGRSSVRDTTQNVCPHSASSANGRITCSFSKAISTGDTTQDKTLNASYHLLQVATTSAPSGSGNTLAPTYHATTPTATAAVNLVSFLTSGGSYSTSPPSTAGCPSVFATGSYRLTASVPSSCEQSTCDFYLAVRTNPNNPLYLDFWMEGNAKGYIAIGFSPDGEMADSDVIMCGVDSAGGVVRVVDAYNPGYTSVRDSSQDVCPFSASSTNGRIQCSFSRLMTTGDTAEDKSLTGTNYVFLMAAVDNAPSGSGNTLSPSAHGAQEPRRSSQSADPSQFTGSLGAGATVPKAALTKTHGILMLISWPLLAVTGIFFAAWMKPAMGPPPMPPKWFTLHRVFMLASMFIGAAGFVLIFIANFDNEGIISLTVSPGNLAHFLIGIFVMALHIANPIISAFRCLPTSPRRWIFNLLHGSLIGFAVEMLALINCGIGLSLYESNGYTSSPGTYRTLGIYVTYAVLLFLLFVALFSMFTGIALVTGGEKGLKLGPAIIKPILEYYIGEQKAPDPTLFKNTPSEIPGTSSEPTVTAVPKNESKPATPTPPPATPVTKQPKSKDVVLRWIGLSIYLFITVPFMLIVIVLVAS